MNAGQIEKLKALALAAEKDGQHIYTNPRDSNKWKDNEAWQQAASPEAFSELIAEVERLRADPLYSTRQDAERFRRAIALEDSAEALYAAVMNNGRDADAIRREFDAAIGVHPKPCRNEIINSGALAIPKSCPRCGLAKDCPAGVVAGAHTKAGRLAEKDANPAESSIDKIREAIGGYYRALNARQHGELAMDRAFRAIECELGMGWDMWTRAEQAAKLNQAAERSGAEGNSA